MRAPDEGLRPRYNIAPTQTAAIVRPADEGREVAFARWGLIPSWAKDIKIGYRMINARGETVAEKPSFRAAFKRRRCLVPASGYYEWKKLSAKTKQPYHIHRDDDGLIAFAGLWERWDAGDAPLESFTIITTAAGGALADIHDRMPVMLPESEHALWLDPDVEPEALGELLHPHDDEIELVADEVSAYAVLLETAALGNGQTVASQGILHGGLKYTLQGMLTGSALGIRDMPAIWENCLAGAREPNLSRTRLRARHCWLWRTDTVASKLGMIGAKFGLRVAPQSIDAAERPEILADCPGTVARLDEPVIATDSLLADFAERNRDRILKIDARNGLRFETGAPGEVAAITIEDSASARSIRLEPGHVVFTAGAGNAGLRELAGLHTPAMQRRPLHMVLVREGSARSPALASTLPELNGHCVDGRKTRVTITSDVDADGRRIWQVGGQVAEVGVDMTPADLIAHTQAELQAAIPGLDLKGTEWSTYRVDRAEQLQKNNRRPETVSILREGNTITAWPTKLVLAPQLAANIADAITTQRTDTSFDENKFADWPRPEVALPPWEMLREWVGDADENCGAESAA
eukprot:g18345.t1